MRWLKYDKLNEIIDSIEEAEGIIESCSPDVKEQLCIDMENAVHSVNQELFSYEVVEVENDLKQWIDLVRNVIKSRDKCVNHVDLDYAQLMDAFTNVSGEDLLKKANESFATLRKDWREYITWFYCRHEYLWGNYNPEQNDYSAVSDRIRVVKEHKEDFLFLYDHLVDYRSKSVLVNLLHYWMTFDPAFLRAMRETVFEEYFDFDIINIPDQAVFVDAGAFIGDTVEQIVKFMTNYKHIYSFEAAPVNYQLLKKNTENFSNVTVLNKAVGGHNGMIKMNYSTVPDSGDSVLRGQEVGSASMDIEMITLDEEIRERLSVIKMDIEGAEQSAIEGCRRHITEEHPTLIICVYHKNDDIWKIIRTIYDMDNTYRFYLRCNCDNIVPTDIVLFAV